jgi:hypothetical protein
METDHFALRNYGHVSAQYQHIPKDIATRDDFVIPVAHLKWYDIARAAVSIPDHIDAEAREFLRSEVANSRLSLAADLGFVINHLSGDSVYLLLVCTWRNNNEMWESLYYKDTRAGGPFRQVPQGGHRGVMCVWEFGAIAHEHQAWTRYLYTARDEQAKRNYLADKYSGPVSRDDAAPAAVAPHSKFLH